MTLETWIGSDGDWNDPNNWLSGTVPLPTNTVLFPNGGDDTVEGSAFIGGLILQGANLSVSGSFSSDGSDPSYISDTPGTTMPSTLTIDPWGSLSLGTLTLSAGSLIEQGLLITGVATVQGGVVSGSSAEWFSSDTIVEGTLSIVDGGAFEGNISLISGADLVTDGNSIISSGTLSVAGDAEINFESPSDGGASGSQLLEDSIVLNSGADLSIVSPSGAPVNVQGNIVGSGTISLVGASLVVSAPSAPSAVAFGEQKTALLAFVGSGSNSSDFALTSSILDLSLQSANGAQSDVVSCSGDADAVYGGNQSIVVTSSGARLIDFHGGSGSNTVTAGASILSYVQGKGAGTVTCGTSGLDTVQVGSGSATVQASEGSQVVIRGSGPTTVEGGAGAGLVDDTDGSGSAIVYGNTGEGTSSVLGGRGTMTVQGSTGTLFVQGGSGDLVVWGGTSGDDTIVGGTGRNTLIGGVGALVIANGSGSGVYGLSASGGTVNASTSSGNDTIFATGGQGVSRLVGGSGTDTFLGNRATLDVTCGGGTNYVWGGDGTSDTLVGGSGNDVLQGGASATIALNGSGKNVVLSNGAGTAIDCQNASGSIVVFASGEGSTSIEAAQSELTAVVGDTTLDVNASGVGAVLWCENNSTIAAVGGGATTFVAAGTADDINAAQDGGDNTFVLTLGLGSVVTLGKGDNYVLAGSSNATITGGAGSTTIFGGSGGLDINLSAPEDVVGTTTVLGFDGSNDLLSFSSSDIISTIQTSVGIELLSSHESVLLYQYFGPVSPSH